MRHSLKTARLGAWASLVAAGQLIFATVAHAQEPAAAPPAVAPAPPPPAQADDAEEGAPPGARPYAPPPPPPPAYPQPQVGWYPPGQSQRGFLYPPTAGPIVRLSTTNPRARLQTMQLKWRDVCVAPCGVRVDPGAVYRIGGGTIRPSSDFTMPRSTGVVYVNTEPGSTVKHWVGVGVTIGGGVTAGIGALLLALSQDTQSRDPYDSSSSDLALVYGVTYLVTGLVMLAIGIPLALSSTSVDVR